MTTPFAAPANNLVTVVGAGGYVAGSTVLALAAGQGALYPVLTGNQTYRLTVITAALAYSPTVTSANLTIFKATSLTTDTFHGVVAIEGTTDRNYFSGDVVDIRVTAGTISDIQVAVNTLEYISNQPSITGDTVLTSAAFGTTQSCFGTSANFAVTLPSVSGNSGKIIGFTMQPGLTKFVTLVRNAGDLIDGAVSRIMWANETATLYCTGTNWIKISGKSIPMTCTIYRATNQSISNNVQTNVAFDSLLNDNTGLMASLSNNRIIMYRPSNYILTTSILWNPFTATSTNTQIRLQFNGVTGFLSIALASIGSYVSSSGTFVQKFALNDYVQTALLHLSGGTETILGGPATATLTAQEVATW